MKNDLCIIAVFSLNYYFIKIWGLNQI